MHFRFSAFDIKIRRRRDSIHGRILLPIYLPPLHRAKAINIFMPRVVVIAAAKRTHTHSTGATRKVKAFFPRERATRALNGFIFVARWLRKKRRRRKGWGIVN